MKIIYIIGFLLFFDFGFAAGPIKGIVLDKDNLGQPIVGANIYWQNTAQGTTSDENGHFSIRKENGNKMLVVSFVGYNEKVINITEEDVSVIYLKPNIELGEVTVSKRRKGQYISRINPVQSTKITASELTKCACCNLSESFETNASVDVNYSDALTGAKQIKLLGLSGIYVQTISENMPLIRGMAAPYGLSYVPGSWMESIQVSKGTSSVVNGYEAISGQINVEYKKPNGIEKLGVNLFVDEELKTEANVTYSIAINDSLSTMLLLHAENMADEKDHNHDSFMDMPLVKQVNLMNRWYMTNKSGGSRQLAVRIIDEGRRSGQIGAFENDNSGLYGIDIKTKHYDFFAKNGILLNRVGTSIGMQLSGSYHNQDSYYGENIYKGTQYNGYFNFIYQGNFGSDAHTYKTGFSFLGDSFDESLNLNKSEHTEYVPGIYAEYSLHLNEKFNLLSGLRADYSSQYGFFVTPRIHAKWDISPLVTVRGSAGKGYRTPIPLAENSYLLASSREIIVDDDLGQEEAVNLGASIIVTLPLGGRDFTLMGDYYHTGFINQVVRNVDSDAHAVHFMDKEGSSYSNSFQAELIYELVKGLNVNAAYRINDVQQTIDGDKREVPLISKYKGMLSLSYATRLNKWQFDVTGQFNGGGRMPDPDKGNPLWKSDFSPYNVYVAQITKNLKNWSFYVGAENLGSFTMDKPIIGAENPWGDNFDGSMIWGPINRRKIYFGLRYTINTYK